MDQTDQPVTDNQTPASTSIISDEQKQSFLSELGLDSLPEEQKTDLVNTMMETVMNRIFTRISPVLTDQDATMLETLQNSGEQAESLVLQYLSSKVPNLSQIVAEELSEFKQEMKKDVTDIQASLT